MKIVKMRQLLLRLNWRARRALRSAEVLDDVVDAQVALLPQLPDDVRKRSADHLAELVMLSQDYRHFAAGWISRRELERRGRETLGRLESIKHPSLQQLTERE